MASRFRGTKDVPPTPRGLSNAADLGTAVRDAGGFDKIITDPLSRCHKTAEAIWAPEIVDHFGPRPWAMGHFFEGREITPDSLWLAKHYWQHPSETPPGGEPFREWLNDWTTFLSVMHYTYDPLNIKLGIITHNRNIQASYAWRGGRVDPEIYDNDGPDFLTVHKHERDWTVAPWDGKKLEPGIYLIRHCETSWGT